ncbi:hypothetical protein RJ639_037636 [Escallonia herrerae]|uniref:Uncharacterized protein n=1 Tax=Escallonia herrerae TaxID=1293975 RepID=A0AA89B845_9ASTE|nr:hypothetical protein RJ639_037636 [Escallonia herrerae]
MSLTRQIDGNNFGSELTRDSSEDEQPRLYALTKAELELLVIRTFQRDVAPMLESLVRRIVNEQFELAQQKVLISMKRISENETSTSEPRNLQLQFLNKISLPVLTGKDIEGEECDSIKLALVDCLTGEVVKFGAEAAAVVEIVILEGEFKDGERDSWTHEDFNDKIVREREGRKSILRGNTYLKLQEGTVSLGRISITHNSDWMKNCKLRIGARVVDNSSGIRIKEAISESFPVKDRRSKLYEKHYPPSLCDEVWRLEMIGKKGAFYKRLSGVRITTVKDFLTLLSINPRRLQDILKAGDRTWKIIIEHARTCLIGKGMYVYYNVPNSQEKTGVLFDVEGVPVGLLKESQWVPLDKLSENEKARFSCFCILSFSRSFDLFQLKKCDSGNRTQHTGWWNPHLSTGKKYYLMTMRVFRCMALSSRCTPPGLIGLSIESDGGGLSYTAGLNGFQ